MKSIWITSILGLSVLVAGCATANKGAAPRPNVNQQQIKVQQTAPQDKASLNNAQIATRLEQIAKSNPNVQKARCVVFGRTAIVGIDIKEDMKRSQVGSVKFSVAEALKKDPYGANSVVTADADVNKRISNILEETRKGRPITGFTTELSDIVGRIMPQLPRDTQIAPNTNMNSTPQDPASPGSAAQ
ncbi:YhcN/YlaJ family sporulation lipoprotein [Paenibacillus larvae]|uniref:Lipoprotein-like protein n=3 Tax=Paenibacillus larvae TaxID=1464 RepID=V9WB00_9BACL|nr:YhcN/YlaJ family sporulation lipoprotein [Paenibacillus larvae]AHD06282.1 lipoprotein-like protein [Paenibacillus larvae subsp. larvae DSM 25430]AQR77345.1 hypothetical protein BXP28_08270 [Paenibacillus larvae subsp. larvae]AVF21651.1 lipoprotein-like protein [Paenibacillus larvae subsp. larvae]AVG12820.1 lipoprotein-like protein [Paenibacillus larvae subsp. larvae DSM 25430]ETK27656.1 lipoprotein-like protein [Paenibacillus larvae subsp. larvae DSM 25719]